jgi:hypothetical protein
MRETKTETIYGLCTTVLGFSLFHYFADRKLEMRPIYGWLSLGIAGIMALAALITNIRRSRKPAEEPIKRRASFNSEPVLPDSVARIQASERLLQERAKISLPPSPPTVTNNAAAPKETQTAVTSSAVPSSVSEARHDVADRATLTEVLLEIRALDKKEDARVTIEQTKDWDRRLRELFRCSEDPNVREDAFKLWEALIETWVQGLRAQGKVDVAETWEKAANKLKESHRQVTWAKEFIKQPDWIERLIRHESNEATQAGRISGAQQEPARVNPNIADATDRAMLAQIIQEMTANPEAAFSSEAGLEWNQRLSLLFQCSPDAQVRADAFYVWDTFIDSLIHILEREGNYEMVEKWEMRKVQINRKRELGLLYVGAESGETSATGG